MYCYYPLMQLLTLAFLHLSALLVDFSHFQLVLNLNLGAAIIVWFLKLVCVMYHDNILMVHVQLPQHFLACTA